MFPVKDNEIEWKYSTSAKSHCPDLTGIYEDDGKIYTLLSGGTGRPTRGATFTRIRDLPHETVERPRTVKFRSKVRQTNLILEITLADTSGAPYFVAFVPLDAPHIGCTDNALVIHHLVNIAKAEAGVGTIQYSEKLVRKQPDGGLIVERWSAQRSRSNWTGKAVGPIQDSMHNIWRFPSVSQ